MVIIHDGTRRSLISVLARIAERGEQDSAHWTIIQTMPNETAHARCQALDDRHQATSDQQTNERFDGHRERS
jgi:hypothetical protein